MFWRIWLCRRSARGYFNSDTLLFEFRCLPIEHVGSMLTAPAFEKYVWKWLHTVLADIFLYIYIERERVYFLPERTLEIHHLLMLKHVIPKVSAASLRVAPCTSSISRRCIDWFLWVERRTSIDPCFPKSRWWFQSSFFLASSAYFPEVKCKFQGGYIFAIGGFKHFLFLPLLGGNDPIIGLIFFKWVEITN